MDLLANSKLDQLMGQEPVRWVRVAGIQAKVLGGQRGHAGARGILEHACACEPGECGVCAAPVTFCLH